MAPPFTVEPALPEELAPALRLVFRHLPEADRCIRVANALALLCQGELDPQGILVVRGGAGLLGALVSVRLPGAAGLVWPPQAVDGPSRTALEDELMREACARLRQGGARVGEAILAPPEAFLAAALVRNGFDYITNLWYLRYDLAARQPAEEPPSSPTPFGGFTFHAQPDCPPDLFQQTLMRTYEGTLDCPELSGTRTAEEIVEGHRGQGGHNPNLWWLAFREGQPAGVLLLAEVPEWEALDVSYLGVVPEARGHGLGRALMRKALSAAQQAGVARVTLAVDSRNLPAQNVYLGLGFERQEERQVYLAIWGKVPAPVSRHPPQGEPGA